MIAITQVAKKKRKKVIDPLSSHKLTHTPKIGYGSIRKLIQKLAMWADFVTINLHAIYLTTC